MREARYVAGGEDIRELYLPPNFAMNQKLLRKIRSNKKQLKINVKKASLPTQHTTYLQIPSGVTVVPWVEIADGAPTFTLGTNLSFQLWPGLMSQGKTHRPGVAVRKKHFFSPQ